MKKILFVDSRFPSEYDSESLRNKGLGGSEASMVRVATGLAARGYDVRVSQQKRESINDVFYPNTVVHSNWVPDVVVAFRSASILPFARLRWPNAVNILWLTDIVGAQFWEEFELVAQRPTTVVLLSDYHMSGVSDVMHADSSRSDRWKNIRLCKIALPIDDSLMMSGVPVDPFKLVFFSSPVKGLTETLEQFSGLRRLDSRFMLHISNPGYMKSFEGQLPGLVNHGVLSNSEALEHVRSASLVFYGNYTFPETFGLVFAEANAVGTPVVAYDFGSAGEVLGGQSNALISLGDSVSFLNAVQEYAAARPVVAANPKYRLSSVLDAWERIFD